MSIDARTSVPAPAASARHWSVRKDAHAPSATAARPEDIRRRVEGVDDAVKDEIRAAFRALPDVLEEEVEFGVNAVLVLVLRCDNFHQRYGVTRRDDVSTLLLRDLDAVDLRTLHDIRLVSGERFLDAAFDPVKGVLGIDFWNDLERAGAEARRPRVYQRRECPRPRTCRVAFEELSLAEAQSISRALCEEVVNRKEKLRCKNSVRCSSPRTEGDKYRWTISISHVGKVSLSFLDHVERLYGCFLEGVELGRRDDRHLCFRLAKTLPKPPRKRSRPEDEAGNAKTDPSVRPLKLPKVDSRRPGVSSCVVM